MSYGLYLEISGGEGVKKLQKSCQKENLQNILNKAIQKTGTQTKRIVKDDVDNFYHGGKSWIGSAVKEPQKGFMKCVIPVRSTKGVLGQTFAAGGSAYNSGPSGAYGFNSKKAWGKLRLKKGGKITAHIVKSAASTLPDKLPNQGGNPPFMNGGTVKTRRTYKSKPLVRVVGLSVPQMVNTRASSAITNDIYDKVDENIMDELNKL